MNSTAPLLCNGWTLYAHPLFLDQLQRLIQQVAALREKEPLLWQSKNASKRLIAINHLIFTAIPQDPGRAEYRQGHTLGAAHTHWFRAKFFQQYRLFFRYHRESRIIVYAWVNDEQHKRAFESDDDAYRVFGKMLAAGKPPNDWQQLLHEAKEEQARLQQLGKQLR